MIKRIPAENCIRRHRNLVWLAVGFTLFLFGGTGEGLAQGVEGDGNAGVFCKMKWMNITTDVTVADHATSDNPPYPPITSTEPNGFVFHQDCTGPVVGTLTVEITGRLHIHEVWAQCLSNLGLPNGCTPGVDDVNIGYEQNTGNGIHRLLDSDGSRVEVSYPLLTARFVWPKLRPGQWKFFVLSGCIGDCPVTIKSGTFTIEAYSRR